MSVFEYNIAERPLSLALGSFDGLHIGHASVLGAAKELSLKKGIEPAVLLFDEHPRRLLFGEKPAALLSDEDRDATLKKDGFNLIRVRFSKIRDMSPREFVDLLFGEFDIKALCCGFNFRYGKDGKGDVKTLSNECEKRGVQLSISEPVMLDGEIVSSTRIRRLLLNGNVREACRMLGRPFSFSGRVVDGDKRGRLLGFPTANQLLPEGILIPKRGVYASIAEFDGKQFPAATNIGIRPTFKLTELLSETHIIGFEGDIYGCILKVSLLDFIRDETDCISAEGLSVQLKKDIEAAKMIYKKETGNENT